MIAFLSTLNFFQLVILVVCFLALFSIMSGIFWYPITKRIDKLIGDGVAEMTAEEFKKLIGEDDDDDEMSE